MRMNRIHKIAITLVMVLFLVLDTICAVVTLDFDGGKANIVMGRSILRRTRVSRY